MTAMSIPTATAIIPLCLIVMRNPISRGMDSRQLLRAGGQNVHQSLGCYGVFARCPGFFRQLRKFECVESDGAHGRVIGPVVEVNSFPHFPCGAWKRGKFSLRSPMYLSPRRREQ